MWFNSASLDSLRLVRPNSFSGSPVLRSTMTTMPNLDLQAAWTYHNATKHSALSIRTNPHFLDWANQPLSFKIYPKLEPLTLPREVRESGVAALSAIAETIHPNNAVPDLNSISQSLYFSAGITRRRTYPGGQLYFRAAACTGALYEIELYFTCGSLAGLEAGLYHFAPADFSLRRLRAGDRRGVLVEATAAEPSIAHAPLIVICTGTYWRNAWKYQARTYRHFFWDNGTLLANLLAMATALRLPARLVMGFVDDDVNRLLGLDTRREVTISLIALGGGDELLREQSSPLEEINYPILPYSTKEVDYPLM